jgi:hypothetical protein
MKFESMIIGLGVAILVTFCVTQILNFYGIGINIYGSYVAFYGFLLLTTYVLPTTYPQLTS